MRRTPRYLAVVAAMSLVAGTCAPDGRANSRTKVRSRRSPPLPHQHSGRGTRRPSPTRGGDTVARPGDGHGSIPGREAGEDPVARPLLGDGIRLAEGGGEAECLAAVCDRDRRAGHSVHPRPLPPSERLAADHHPWLARLDPRTPEGHWSAHRSHGLWRTRGGCLRPRAALDARLWLLGQTDTALAGVPTASRAPGMCS